MRFGTSQRTGKYLGKSVKGIFQQSKKVASRSQTKGMVKMPDTKTKLRMGLFGLAVIAPMAIIGEGLAHSPGNTTGGHESERDYYEKIVIKKKKYEHKHAFKRRVMRSRYNAYKANMLPTEKTHRPDHVHGLNGWVQDHKHHYLYIKVKKRRKGGCGKYSIAPRCR